MNDALLYFSKDQAITKTAQQENVEIAGSNVLEVNGLSDKMDLVLMVKKPFAISGSGQMKMIVKTSDDENFEEDKIVHIGIYTPKEISGLGVIDKLGKFICKKYIKVVYGFDEFNHAGDPVIVTDGAVDCFLTSNSDTKGSQAEKILETGIEKVSTPQVDTEDGTYVTSKTVTVTCDTPGAEIHFTKDGSEPDGNSELAENGEIVLDASCTLKVRAVKEGMNDSDVVSRDIVIQCATVTSSPDTSTFANSTSVTLACATSGATIYYTDDGNEPTAASTEYTTPIALTDTKTIKAIAVKTGLTNSAVMEKIFTKAAAVATPTASPDGGNFETSQEVTLACVTEGATIYYTDDNSTPTAESTEYTAPFTLTATKIIKAIALKEGSSDSAVMTKTFTKTN